MPHVVEPSFGVDRTILCILEHCYRKGGGAEKRDWEWFDFPASISPFDAAVLPLMKKDGLAEKAYGLADSLREKGFDILYDEAGSIGKRYARQDEIGTPYCLTVDYDTLKDATVTIRFRNDGKQAREKIDKLEEKISSFIKGNVLCLP
jgi:glycyl-tRNA synthetase